MAKGCDTVEVLRGPAGPIGPQGPIGMSGGNALLGKLIGFDLNITSDQQITLTGGTNFIVTDVVATNISSALTTATGFEIWDQPSAGGVNVCVQRSTVTLSVLQTARNFINNFNHTAGTVIGNWLNFIINKDSSTVGNTLYASVSTPEGSVLTCDLYVYGYVLQ